MFWLGDSSENIYELKIFEWIDKGVIENIIQNCEHRTFNNAEMILMQEEESNWEWYIIKKWSVNISINWESIAQLSTWDIFGEIALLSEEERTASVYSQWETEVIVLKIDDIVQMLSSDNTINKTIIDRIEENISRN